MKSLKLLLFICITFTSLNAQNNFSTEYFRQLRYNHVSPYIPLAGTHQIDSITAQSTSHYIFKYDGSNRLTEIINNHYFTEKVHPLASIGVYKLVFEYSKNKVTRTFFDMNGKRISNDRGIYKEVYSHNKNGFINNLKFYDLEDKPMESNWGIAEYQWEKHKKLIIENRFNLKNEPVPLSPYFQFGTTGILLDKKGLPKAHYNLDTNLNIINNDKGTASYQDTYDDKDNHIKYSYHDANDNLIMNQWGFAYGIKEYDSIGNQIRLNQFNTKGEQIRTREIYSNTTIEYASSASKKDTLKIHNTSLGYIKALQQLKPDVMNQVMNDSLNKVSIGYDRETKKEYARATTKTDMMAFANNWNKANNKFPFKPNDQIEILDIYNRIATVKVFSDNWVDYLHLIKLDGEWSIINILWQHKDINRYPKE
ncbi:nuclear transport factor 2 family protein [Xanthomarina sp. GH4-25]|uniref:nuclear transport factor 2 family protein n=1 Tax=Xanthomarina sp. GH4-25 TaxID=3349335 RepID=UPI003877B086